jgi:hypothetical protein
MKTAGGSDENASRGVNRFATGYVPEWLLRRGSIAVGQIDTGDSAEGCEETRLTRDAAWVISPFRPRVEPAKLITFLR